MPRERCLINMLLRVVALLFRVEAHSGSMASQACCPAGRTGRYQPIVEQRAHLRLIRNGFAERLLSELTGEGISVALSTDDGPKARNDLAWAISVGGIGTVLFATLVLFTWYFAATLFLIFAGMLLGVALNAMTELLGRVVRLAHALRLTIVCLVLASLLSGVIFLGGATIAQQATVLSNTIKSQLVSRQGLPREERDRHQLFRSRQSQRICGFDGPGNAGRCDT